MEFESLYDSLGTFGPYQIQVFLLVSLMETPAAWAMLLPVFTGATPSWWCNTNYTNASRENFSVNASRFPLKTCINECHYITFDTSEFTSIVTEFDLVCDHSYVSDLITTLQMLGLFLGATLAGQLADLYGRKKIMFGFYTIFTIFGIGSAFATSWMLYAVLRFFVGSGIGGFLVVNFTLPIEYVGMKWRTFCGCVGFWAVGVMILAGIASLIRDWRYLCIATSVGGIPFMALWWFIPESCRWLATRERFAEAEEILIKMAVNNKKPVPDFGALRTFAKNEDERRKALKKYSYWHLCLTPKSAFYTFICTYGWFASSSVYYGVSFNLKNLTGNRYLNVFLSGLVEIPALVFVLLVNNRIGRRLTVLLLFLLTGLSLLSVMTVQWIDAGNDIAVLVLVLIGKSAISGGWAAVQVFSAEHFPTIVRNLGIGSCAMAARVGGVVAPQLLRLNDFSFQYPLIVFGGIAVVCAILMLCVPETANTPLKDKLTQPDRIVTFEMTGFSSNQTDDTNDDEQDDSSNQPTTR